ncbi:MAG: hypothetical protein JWM80_90 [Cyanobacteria bacterium RYN_339]|nr:hypothetical protein [Cyanobacteria bacterium RYN_339]
MIPCFYVPGGGDRPASRQTIYADGSADEHFREGVDLELSHWLPNRTPIPYKADTSTEICLRFVDAPLPGDWDLAVNNHLDVDGVLSVYALVHSDRALAHRDTLIGAARMGDFWDWAPLPAQVLFQGLVNFQHAHPWGSIGLMDLYTRCFTRINQLLAADPEAVPDARPGIDALARGCERAAALRKPIHDRFVHYPLERLEPVPDFNAPLDPTLAVPVQARNRYDRERIQLLSAPVAGGWAYELWYPGYRWAETPDSWAAPGFTFTGSTNGYRYDHAPLEVAVAALDGTWHRAEELTPFKAAPGRNYPVILYNEGTAHPPDEVVAILAAAF